MARKKDPYDWGTGRRKTAVARVRMKSGTGKFVVNKRELEKYFTTPAERLVVRLPLKAAGCVTTVDIIVNTHGGGTASGNREMGRSEQRRQVVDKGCKVGGNPGLGI